MSLSKSSTEGGSNEISENNSDCVLYDVSVSIEEQETSSQKPQSLIR